MADIGEVGRVVHDTLGGQSTKLASLLGGAGSLATQLYEQFKVVTDGSENDLTGQIASHLEHVHSDVGHALGELAQARVKGRRLLAIWGINAAGVRTESIQPIPAEPAERAGALEAPSGDADSTGQSIYDQKNKKRLAAPRHREMYKRMGIDLATLGYVMLDVEPVRVSDVIRPDDLYYAHDPVKNPYSSGVKSEEVPHITLLQGLMKPGPEMRDEITEVLGDWKPKTVTITEVSYFAGADPNEPFDCIVAHVDTDGLKEGNSRLSLLPHINMYPGEFRAHISLAYIKQDAARRDEYIAELNRRYAGTQLSVQGLNYGA